MAGHSNKSNIIRLRLPNDVLETIASRARKNNVSSYEYLKERIIYDLRRKHTRGKEIPIAP